MLSRDDLGSITTLYGMLGILAGSPIFLSFDFVPIGALTASARNSPRRFSFKRAGRLAAQLTR